jgi:GT2 family glycosyltransferase
MNQYIDVVIPTYNRPDVVSKTVEAVLKQLSGNDRLIIVWQGVRPDITPVERLSLVHSSPPNLPRARNRGIRAGKNPLVLMLDDDVEVSPQLCESHKAAYADNNTGCVAGYIDDPVYEKAQGSPSEFDWTTGNFTQNFSYDKSCGCISAPGGNISVRRELFAALGGFDENFCGNALWEEVDFSFRLRAAGHKIMFDASAKLKHLRYPKGGCRNNKKPSYVYRQFVNTAYFAARWAPRQYLKSWLNYWKYRLEFISRNKQAGIFKHSPVILTAAAAGACEGLLRYAAFGKMLEPKGFLSGKADLIK